LTSPNNLTRDEARVRASLIDDLRYEVELDLTSAGSFRSQTVVRFACRDQGARSHIDLSARDIRSIELNGRPLPVDAFDGHRIALTDLSDQNELRIDADCLYHAAEFGMHRFEDPVDGAVYAHTHFEPFGAHRVFACFDQPDLKATFEFSLVVPAEWEAISNARPAGPAQNEGPGTARWRFAPTRPMSAYITAIAAGPYHAVRDRHRDIDLGLMCRRSLAEHLEADELLEITRAGFDFFEAAFGYPYPFDKYDQVFIPESNSGAMENAGLITINDIYLFRSRVTNAARERRANTILHEMAHMWFGDLVTMRWWNDLWLNESFATFMATLSQVDATRFTEGWTTFASAEKTWAYRQDQLPTTHPIVAEVPDVESVHLNFDGISYAKGASVLRQLVAWVGKDRFLDGMKLYTKRHEFGNAELADFLAVLEEVSGRDLRSWSREWLESAGVNTVRARFSTHEEDGQEVFDSVWLEQTAPPEWPTLRPHRIAIGLYEATGDDLARRRRVELDLTGERTEVPELAGERVPDLVLVNDDDLTYAKIRLDERSLGTAVERLGHLDDSLARTLCWNACWDMTRDGELPARRYVDLVIRNIRRESDIAVVQGLLGHAAAAVYVYGDPANRDYAGQELADAALDGLRSAEAGSDHQLAWARAFTSAARSAEHVAVARGILEGSEAFDGLAVDTELRWHIVLALAARGAVDENAIEAEARRDPTDRGGRYAAAARAAQPAAPAKQQAWSTIVEDGSQPLATIEEIMGGFHQYGQEEVLRPYAERFFEALPGVWDSRDLPEALAFGRAMFPHLVIEPATIELTDRHLSSGGVAGPARRLVLEGRDAVARALRGRAADRAASTA
jgi:aminopeptidase N